MSRRNPILFRILDSFFRYRWLFLLSVLVVSGTTMLLIISRSSTYQATALTQVSNQNIADVLGEQEHVMWISPAQVNVNKFNDLVNDDLPNGFLDQALQAAHLDKPINLDPRAADERYRLLRKKLSASPQGSTLFGISLSWPDKGECERIVTALQHQYTAEVGLDRSAQSIQAGQFLDNRLTDYKNRLETAEKALIAYKLRNAGATPDQNSAIISQLNSLIAARDNLMIIANSAALKRAALTAALARTPKTSLQARTISQSPLSRQVQGLKARVDMLETRYLPTHPEVIQAKNMLKSAEQRLAELEKSNSSEARASSSSIYQDNPAYSTMQERLADATIEEQTQNDQLKNLSLRIAEYQQRVREMPEQERTLSNQMRGYKILQDEYDSLQSRREHIRLKGSLDQISATSTLSRIGSVYAEPSLTPVKYTIMLVASILFGFLVGILMVVLCEWSDHSVRYELDAERILGLPVLAVIPETSNLLHLNSPGGGRNRRRLASQEKKARAALPAPPAAAMTASTSDAKP